jgi:glycosyltransferase involved in cell wall biosynthesis
LSSNQPSLVRSGATVSVIIPTYNRAYILGDALKSALDQTFDDLEILVVDDGSSDNTREVVESFGNPKIRYIRHQENRGCSAGYNTGIREATGSVVAFLDSDDKWNPEFLSSHVNFLRRHPEVDVVFCDTEIQAMSGDTARLMTSMRAFPNYLRKSGQNADYVLAGREMYLCLLEEIPIKPTAAIVRRSTLNQVGLFDEGWPSGTDWDLFLRFSRVANFGYMDRVLVTQRRTVDATHRKFLEDDKLFLIGLFLREKDNLVDDPEALRSLNRGLAGFYNSLAWNYLQSGRRRKALATYFNGFKETLRPKLLGKLASAILRIGTASVRGTSGWRQSRGQSGATVESAAELARQNMVTRQESITVNNYIGTGNLRAPRVSVVMASYNRGYIIREALESALNQTYRDFEVIVVDDGSGDDTREIVESFAGEQIRYIRHDRNRGYSAASNTGISAATGEFVGFLDSDDLWKPDKLERQVDFFARHPEVDVVFSDVEVAGGGEAIPSLVALMSRFQETLRRKSMAEECILSGREMYLCLLEEIPVKPTALLVRRETCQKVGNFDETWPSGTDWDLFLRFSRRSSFGYIRRALAVQRRTSDATHSKFREQDKLFLLDLFLRERAKLKNDREAFAAATRGISSHCNNLGWYYLHAGQRKKSMAAYLKGFKETREPLLLLRAASTIMPLSLREALRSTFKKNRDHVAMPADQTTR